MLFEGRRGVRVASKEHLLLLRLLADPKAAPGAVELLQSLTRSALQGDASMAAGMLQLAAEALRSNAHMPVFFWQFLAIALDDASHSHDACKRIAGNPRKGKNAARDRAMFSQYKEVKAAAALFPHLKGIGTDDLPGNDEDRFDLIGAQFGVNGEVVEKVVKPRKSAARELTQARDKAIAEADAILAVAGIDPERVRGKKHL
jgi:hypothetical protein